MAPILGVLGRSFSRLIARRSASIEPGQVFGSGLGLPNLSGIVVTPQTALQFMAVYGAINTISTDVAKLPRRVMKRSRNGGAVPYSKHPVRRLLVKPNDESNGFRYWQASMGRCLGWGNDYSEIIRDGDGTPRKLWPLHPGHIKPKRTSSKTLYYEDQNTGKRWDPENILHIAGLGFDGISGYSPIMMGRQAIGAGIGAEQFGATFFGNGAVPQGLLKTAKRLTEAAARRLRESFGLVHGGSANANRLAVLEEGLEWQNTQVAPEAAQFLATRQFSVLEIARMFNIPPHKLMDYSQSHLANVEESNRDYLETTLMAWLAALEAEINAKLFFEDEQERFYCDHDTSLLLRGNTAARGDYYERMKRNGVLNADTIAAMEGLPLPGPENGGNLYLVQSQNIPQQNAGKPQPKPAPEPKTPSVSTGPDSDPDSPDDLMKDAA